MNRIEELINRYPALNVCKDDISKAFDVLKVCYQSGHKVLIAGNGGSASDADHIVGELMKGFKNKRAIDKELINKVNAIDNSVSADRLQKSLPAIALHNHQSLNTAFANDVENGSEYTFAQQVLGYGQEGDVFIGISTSGDAKNVYNAAVVAKAKQMKVIGLTGKDGGKLKQIADVAIGAPSNETFMIQEYHLPIYHCLCLMLEEEFFN